MCHSDSKNEEFKPVNIAEEMFVVQSFSSAKLIFPKRRRMNILKYSHIKLHIQLSHEFKLIAEVD